AMAERVIERLLIQRGADSGGDTGVPLGLEARAPVIVNREEKGGDPAEPAVDALASRGLLDPVDRAAVTLCRMLRRIRPVLALDEVHAVVDPGGQVSRRAPGFA